MQAPNKRTPYTSRIRAPQFETLEPRQMLATYFVDGQQGNDLQSVGSLEEPFATISRAAIFAQPGDTVAIRGGVYREQVNLIRSGNADAPITFQAYNDEEVLVTATDLLSSWTLHSGDIYKTTFDSSVRQRNTMTLFVDGELMDEAHWSDQGGRVDRLDNQTWAIMSSGTRTTITDTALRNMPEDLWVGSFIQAQSIDWSSELKRIVDFTSNASSGTITVETPFIYDPRAGDAFILYDHLAALDAPGEWYFDEATDTLYLWAPGGVNPNTLEVEAKGPRHDAFDLNGHHYIHIRDIDMRGGDLDMSGSNHILLEGAHIRMPDYGFGPEGSGGARSLIVDGSHNVVRDNEFHGVHGTAVLLGGSNNAIYNNYFHDIGYNNVNGAAFNIRETAEQNLISHNTITRVGRAAIGGPGGVQNVIQYNDFSTIGLMSGDVGAIYFANNSLGNMIIHHNVLHDIDRYKAFGIYFDNNTADATVHHNITYNTDNRGGATNLPNSFVLWFNNTHFNAGNLTTFAPPGSSTAATGTKYFNNLLSSIDPLLLSGDDPAEASNNVFTASAGNFVNAANGDFRLVASSDAIDEGRVIAGITESFEGSAPDAGALEFGQAMWDFGHDFSTPPRPSYSWTAIPYSNRVENPSFDTNLDGWTTVAGTPTRYYGNAWNYRKDALATFGVGSVELKPGDHIEQTVEGLLPNTTYRISAKARVVRDLQLEANDGTNGTYSTGNHRGENYLGGVDAGDWVRFAGVDFGADAPHFDRIEIGTTQNSLLDVELRLGSPTGQLLATLDVPSRNEPWFMTGKDIASVTGSHDLYVVFQGAGGAEGKFDRIRLLNSNEDQRVLLGVRDYDAVGSTSAIVIGGSYWSAAPQGLTFTTGPDANSATLFLTKQGGQLNGYVDSLALSGEAYHAPLESVLKMSVDSDSGRAVLTNNTATAIEFDGYEIRDSAPSLLPDSWFSFEDQSYEGGNWAEANQSPNVLSELMLDQVTTLDPGESVYLGQIIDPTSTVNPTFSYFLAETATLTRGILLLEDVELAEVLGDYSSDAAVSIADYTLWRDYLDSPLPSFTGADGNGSAMVDLPDYLLWRRNFGKAVVSKSLINVTTSNGSFEDFTGGQGAPEHTNANRVANSFDTPGVTDTAVATISGWTSVLEPYLEGSSGNTFAGFDSVSTRASDGTRYAFANKRSRATLTSDPLDHVTQAGDEFTLVFDTGSFTSDDAAYIVRMRFGANTYQIDSFTETTNGNGSIAAYTLDRTYTYVATPADVGVSPVVEFVINAGPNIHGNQWYVDDVRLEVRTSTGPAAAALSRSEIFVATELSSNAMAPAEDSASLTQQPQGMRSVDLLALAAVMASYPNVDSTLHGSGGAAGGIAEAVAHSFISNESRAAELRLVRELAFAVEVDKRNAELGEQAESQPRYERWLLNPQSRTKLEDALNQPLAGADWSID